MKSLYRPSTLKVVEACMAWGARMRTTRHLTGLNRHILTQLAEAASLKMPRGRPDDSCSWYLRTDTSGRIEASILVARFCELQSLGITPVDSLLSSYRSVVSMARDKPQLKFDHAFDLAAKAGGCWTCAHRWLDLSRCTRCHCQYISSFNGKSSTCPFCERLNQ